MLHRSIALLRHLRRKLFQAPGRATRASLGHKGLLRRDFYADFTAGDVKEAGLMPDFNNDNLPSNNPSLKTVLVVLGSIVLVVTFIMYHSTFGL
jgi:hypothetical protein